MNAGTYLATIRVEVPDGAVRHNFPAQVDYRVPVDILPNTDTEGSRWVETIRRTITEMNRNHVSLDSCLPLVLPSVPVTETLLPLVAPVSLSHCVTATVVKLEHAVTGKGAGEEDQAAAQQWFAHWPALLQTARSAKQEGNAYFEQNIGPSALKAYSRAVRVAGTMLVECIDVSVQTLRTEAQLLLAEAVELSLVCVSNMLQVVINDGESSGCRTPACVDQALRRYERAIHLARTYSDLLRSKGGELAANVVRWKLMLRCCKLLRLSGRTIEARAAVSRLLQDCDVAVSSVAASDTRSDTEHRASEVRAACHAESAAIAEEERLLVQTLRGG